MAEVTHCEACGGVLVPQALLCPSCEMPVHVARLEELAGQARAKEAAGDLAGAAEIWRQVLLLLPRETSQAAAIRERIAGLGAPSTPVVEKGKAPEWTKKFGPLGVVIAFLLKFWSVILVGLSKAKFLLLGFTKLKTLFSMMAFFGVYWTQFGWKFALGFVLTIYVHEMGHVWALKREGLRAGAPMFIPFMGAFVSLYDSPTSLSQDARIGLAGPIWGTGAAVACLIPGIFALDGGNMPGGNIWMAIAHTTAFMNLFNLIPVWQLDGGRGFRALDRTQRFMMLALMVGLWAATQQGLFLILALGAAFRIFWSKDHPQEGDMQAVTQFAMLLASLGLILKYVR